MLHLTFCGGWPASSPRVLAEADFAADDIAAARKAAMGQAWVW